MGATSDSSWSIESFGDSSDVAGAACAAGVGDASWASDVPAGAAMRAQRAAISGAPAAPESRERRVWSMDAFSFCDESYH